MYGSTPPKPGELVRVRSRNYVVAEVTGSLLGGDVLADAAGRREHLVDLSSVDDDAYGEELSVIWEIEPGAEILENALLPTPDEFDPPARLDAFLDAVRWGAIESADSKALQAPFRSGIKIEDYQLDPVARAIEMPRVNLLIADDVGLGKTIEAGLVAQELMLRHRARRILIACPASLQIKWRDEMQEKFGLDFKIVNTELMHELRRKRGIRVNPWNHFPRLITSIDYLKRSRPLQRFRECLPAPGEPAYPRRFDLMIVDEAHNVAPSGSGNYARDSQRTLAIRTLAPHFEHKLFLTATPHNGYKESFCALLELLDDQRFARDVEPDPVQLEAVMVHRLKTELKNWDGTPRFAEREIVPLEVELSDEEREAHEKLKKYGELLRTSTAADGRRSVATDFVLTLLKKRFFSCPEAFLYTLEQHERTLRGRGMRKRSKRDLNESVLRRRFEAVQNDDYFDDDDYDDAVFETLDTAGSIFEKLGEDERDLLRELKDWATQASARPDAKFEQLLSFLNDVCRPGGKWSDERVIIFTEYRTTQNWLQGRLATEGLAAGDRLGVIHGGMDEEDREQLKAAFQTSPDLAAIRILLATDSASEGIDLQNHCHRVIHYDIPWNPNRLEQRNGRIDRHGQRHTPQIFHFVSSGWDSKVRDRDLRAGDLDGDLAFLARVVEKVDQIREDLGKVGPVVASQLEAAMLGKRSALDTDQAERDAQPIRAQLRFRKDLEERIRQLHDQLDESRRELHVSPDEVRAVVGTGLELAGQPPLTPATLEGVKEGRVFAMPQLAGTWAACTEGLQHPHTRAVRPVTFDHALAEGRDDVVLVHLGHRLVQMAQRLLRAEVWTTGSTSHLSRVTGRVVPDADLGSPAVVVHARILVLGGNHHRLHEEIITAGGTLESGRFRRLNVGQTRAALAAETDRAIPEKVEASLRALWPTIEDSVRDALDARMKERTKNLKKKLGERKKKDIERMSSVLTELAENIRSQLESKPPDQLDLFSKDERDQFERNRDSLQARLGSIPEEIERETLEIGRRYADPIPRVFPVSVTFLVPEGQCR